MVHRSPRRTAARAGVAVLGVVGLVLALVLVSSGGQVHLAARGTPVGSTSSATTSAEPAPVSASASPTNTHQFTTAAPRTLSSSTHLVVPSVGLDVPVLPLTPEKGVIDPPTQHEGYWIEPYGRPVGPGEATDNTLYIAGHSWSKGSAAFNPLMGQNSKKHSIAVGDVVQVQTAAGTTSYTVTSAEHHAKSELAAATDVWAVSPGRLVLLTCALDVKGRDTDDNLVVVAES